MTSGVEPMRALVSHGAELVMRIFVHPQPVVAACTGHALAAGALDPHVVRPPGRRRRRRSSSASTRSPSAWACPTSPSSWPATGCRPRPFDTVVLGRHVRAGRRRWPPASWTTVVDGDHDALLAARRRTRPQALSALSNGAVAHTKRLARQQLHDDIVERLAPDMAAITGPS